MNRLRVMDIFIGVIAAVGLALAALLVGARVGGTGELPSPAMPSVGSEKQSQGSVEAGGAVFQRAELALTTTLSAPGRRNAYCVDGGLSGLQFLDVNCSRIVETLSEAVEEVEPGSLIVVRAYPSDDRDGIRGMGTYRDGGLRTKVLTATVDSPIIIQAEGFNPNGEFIKPIIDGATRVHGVWERTPGTSNTWQVEFDRMPAGYDHVACVDRIWVSRQPGKTELADFPLTRPLMNQGNDNPSSDCANNTINGRPIAPDDVDNFPGSYSWLNKLLYVHLPGGEDPNDFTIEIPGNFPLSRYESASGLVIRGFRVYHTSNGIDFYHCGTSAANRCEASHNETSFNYPYGLQPGPYSYLHHNSGILNTIQLVKITGDFSEVSYNDVGPQLSHGFKLSGVQGCFVHHNDVYGSSYTVPKDGTQSDWTIIGTRDISAGIYLKNGTKECRVYENLIFENGNGLYIRNDGDTLTHDNEIEGNRILHNNTAIRWREPLTWERNSSNNNEFSWGATFRWGDDMGSFSAYVDATHQDKDSRVAEPSRSGFETGRMAIDSWILTLP